MNYLHNMLRFVLDTPNRRGVISNSRGSFKGFAEGKSRPYRTGCSCGKLAPFYLKTQVEARVEIYSAA